MLLSRLPRPPHDSILSRALSLPKGSGRTKEAAYRRVRLMPTTSALPHASIRTSSYSACLTFSRRGNKHGVYTIATVAPALTGEQAPHRRRKRAVRMRDDPLFSQPLGQRTTLSSSHEGPALSDAEGWRIHPGQQARCPAAARCPARGQTLPRPQGGRGRCPRAGPWW